MNAQPFEHAPPRRRAPAGRLRALLFRAASVALLVAAPAAQPCPAQEAAADRKPADKASGKAADAAAVQTPEPPRAATRGPVLGSIKGRVLGEGGEPLAGVAVRAGGRSAGTLFAPPATATTDEEGQFVLENLEPNVYTISADLPGYITEAETLPAPPRQRIGDTVTLKMAKGGVVTGTVTDASGDPLVGVTVRVTRVRDLEGRPVGGSGRDATTDDRGVYRAYGLQPGVYVVSAGGAPMWSFWPLPRAESAPTYYPSGSRDTAAELTVRTGQETAGIDIRFRDERGQRISGTFVLPPAQPTEDLGGVNISVVHAASGTNVASTWVQGRGDSNNSFSFEGLADGDYELTAQHSTRLGGSSKSSPLRVSVKGADVTGVKLVLAPMASVSGTLSVEQLAEADRARGECKERPAARLFPQETAVYARLDAQPVPRGQARSRFYGSETVPDSGGSFTARNLEPGRYRIEARPVDENFYARSVQLPETAAATVAAAKPGSAPRATPSSTGARDFLELRSGQQLTGVQVRVAEGAASLAGHVVPAEEGGQVPPQTRLYLVPSEREQADNVLRHYAATPAADGAFVFRNLAPGRYLLVARPVNVDPSDPSTLRPPFWDAAERARMRREAEAANLAVELQPCQRTADFTVRYPQAVAK